MTSTTRELIESTSSSVANTVAHTVASSVATTMTTWLASKTTELLTQSSRSLISSSTSSSGSTYSSHSPSSSSNSNVTIIAAAIAAVVGGVILVILFCTFSRKRKVNHLVNEGALQLPHLIDRPEQAENIVIIIDGKAAANETSVKVLPMDLCEEASAQSAYESVVDAQRKENDSVESPDDLEPVVRTDADDTHSSNSAYSNKADPGNESYYNLEDEEYFGFATNANASLPTKGRPKDLVYLDGNVKGSYPGAPKDQHDYIEPTSLYDVPDGWRPPHAEGAAPWDKNQYAFLGQSDSKLYVDIDADAETGDTAVSALPEKPGDNSAVYNLVADTTSKKMADRSVSFLVAKGVFAAPAAKPYEFVDNPYEYFEEPDEGGDFGFDAENVL